MATSQYKVIVDGLNVRKGPGLGYDVVTGATLHQGQIVTVVGYQKDSDRRQWLQHSTGWSVLASTSNTYMQKVSSSTTSSTKISTTSIKDTAESNSKSSIISSSATPTAGGTLYTDYTTNEFNLKSLRSIFGLPHQFVHNTDQRPEGQNYGRMFTENVLMDMPICYIIPGGPKFFTGKGIDEDDKKTLTSIIANIGTAAGNLTDKLTKMLDGKIARYYSFATQYASYIRIVNSLNQTSALYMGLKNEKLYPGADPYYKFNWDSKKIDPDGGSGWLNFARNHGVLSFYYNRQSSGMGETGSNSTTKSALDGLMNSLSSKAKELDFVMGIGAGQQIERLDPTNYYESISKSTSNLTSDSSMISKIMSNLNIGYSTVISGANMMLPEIWNDSSFSRSTTIDFHFASPYGTPEAVYLNIIVPLNFLIALSFPRQLGANGYFSPYLIQANAKGVFNVDLGMVDYIQIQRFGSGDSISRNGLPLEVQVSLSIRSLYNSMSVNNSDDYGMFVNNIGLLDFLANFAAINLNEPDIYRKVSLFIDSKIAQFTSAPSNVLNKIYDSYTQRVRSTFAR